MKDLYNVFATFALLTLVGCAPTGVDMESEESAVERTEDMMMDADRMTEPQANEDYAQSGVLS